MTQINWIISPLPSGGDSGTSEAGARIFSECYGSEWVWTVRTANKRQAHGVTHDRHKARQDAADAVARLEAA